MKCTTALLGEDFVGGSIVKTFARSVVEQVLGTSDFVTADLVEVRTLGKELTGQAVGIFVGPFLPRSVGIGKKHFHVQRAFKLLVLCELAPVVQGHGLTQLGRDWLQPAAHGWTHFLRVLAGDGEQRQVSALTFDQTDQRAAVASRASHE